MIKNFKKSFLLLMCLVMSIGLITSCKKNNDVRSDKIELQSFGPTGARHGDTLRFIGNNLNMVTSIELTGATVPQSAFIKQSGDMIMIIVPHETQQGTVTLKTPQGDIVSKTKLNLKVVPSVTTMTVQARPGENITLNGDLLNWVTRVTFNNNKFVDSFVSKSITKLVVTVPLDAQTGPLVINYAGTEPLQFQTKDTFKVTLPVITALSPNPVKHQTNLTITGTNLDLTKQILFTGASAPTTTFVSQSATQIVVKVDEGTQKGKITLVAASGVSTQSSQDLDVLLPAVTPTTGLSPNPIDPETNLTVKGTNLDLVSGISFTGIASAVTTFVSQSPTQLVVKVPKGTLKGKLILAVLNSKLTVETEVLDIKGGLPALADFTMPIYTDGLQNTFQDWSYTDTHDFNSTANVRQGTKSVKAIYNATNGYQGLTFHAGTPISTAGYTKLEFSVFGEAGTAGKKLNVVVNGNYGTPPQVTLLSGEWQTITITVATLGNPATISEIVLQSAGFGGTVHVDHVGLR